MFRQATRALVPALSARRFATDAPRAATSGKLKFTLASPYQFYYKAAEVDQVNLPSSAGDMGVLANHVPTLAQLRPGVIEVNDGKSTKKFFVSGGFAVINPDSSLNINAVEAVPVEQLDVEAARRALGEAQKRVERATSDKDKVAAEIEVEVYTAVIAA